MTAILRVDIRTILFQDSPNSFARRRTRHGPPYGGTSMKSTLLTAFVVSGFLLAAFPASAHHSFAAEFDISKPVTLKGTLSKMAWVNPHGWIYMDVKGPDGKVENWAVEAGGPTALLHRGLRASDFPPG